MPLLLSFLGILCLITLILWCKLDTFISFIVVSVVLGLASGLNIHQISDAIQKGIGNIMGSLVIILGFGAMLGRLIADSGAAQQITQSLVRLSGIRRIQWAMALAGFLVGHLLECSSQVTGGIFTDWASVPRWEDMGKPIAYSITSAGRHTLSASRQPKCQ